MILRPRRLKARQDRAQWHRATLPVSIPITRPALSQAPAQAPDAPDYRKWLKDENHPELGWRSDLTGAD